MRSSKQFSFLNGPNKLVFDSMYESTLTGLVGPPYSYYSLVAFSAFAWLRLCGFPAFGGGFLCFWCVQNLFVKKKVKSLTLP